MNQQAKALSLAYEFVTKNNSFTKKELSEKLKLNFRTLRRINLGETVRDSTYEYALPAMYDIIEECYQNDLSSTGGDNAVVYLKMMRELLRAVLKRG